MAHWLLKSFVLLQERENGNENQSYTQVPQLRIKNFPYVLFLNGLT